MEMQDKQNAYYLVYAGTRTKDGKAGEFIAGFAQPQAAMEYAKYLIRNRVYKTYFIYITKQTGLKPVFDEVNLEVIIASSGEILMMDGKMYDY